MNRSRWLAIVLALIAVAVAAGWFAVNAPEASRPRFADLGTVRLQKETPPLPPAPLNRTQGRGYEQVLRRPLFTPPKGAALGARGAAGAAQALEGGVAYRELLAPIAPAPKSDLREVETSHAPRDDFQAAFGVDRPRHRQYFGGHLISDESRGPDPEKPPEMSAPVAQGEGPRPSAVAPVPRPRPAKTEIAAAPQGGLSASVSASAADEQPAALSAVAEAATRFDGGGAGAIVDDPALSPEEDIILLGVLLRRGDDRALIRVPSGESRRVSLGDEVAGWRVSSIGEDFIRLRRASQTREIRVPE